MSHYVREVKRGGDFYVMKSAGLSFNCTGKAYRQRLLRLANAFRSP